jgi:hypothetical protein
MIASTLPYTTAKTVGFLSTPSETPRKDDRRPLLIGISVAAVSVLLVLLLGRLLREQS